MSGGGYVNGIVGRDVEGVPETRGIGEPPAKVEVIPCGDVAALVSEIDLDQPIGRTADLMAHKQLLDITVLDAPVVPVRFGAVLDSRDAVTKELLEPHHDEFSAALR